MKKIIVLLIILCMLPMGLSRAETYADINGHWSEEYILAARDMELISISPNEYFSPDGPITLAELLSMLVPLVTGKQPEPATEEEWHTEYVQEAFKLGIMNGFSPEEISSFYTSPSIRMISNVLFANTLYALDISDKQNINKDTVKKSVLGLKTFGDADEILGDLYTVSTYNCVAHGLILGDENAYLLPYDYLTRAQAVTILVRIKRLQIRSSNNIAYINPFSYSEYAYTCLSDGGEAYPVDSKNKSVIDKSGVLFCSMDTTLKILENSQGFVVCDIEKNPFYSKGILTPVTGKYSLTVSEGSSIGLSSYSGYISNDTGAKYKFDFSKGKKIGFFINNEPYLPLENVLEFFSIDASIKANDNNASVVISIK